MSCGEGERPQLATARPTFSLPHSSGVTGLEASSANSRAEAGAVVGDAARRVELDGLERAHERPPQAQPVADGLVEVLGRHVSLADQPHGLRQQHRLHAVEDNPSISLFTTIGTWPTLVEDGARPLDRLGRGPGRAGELDDRHHVRRVDRMRHEAAVAAFSFSVKREVTMAEDDDARMALAAAAASRRGTARS